MKKMLWLSILGAYLFSYKNQAQTLNSIFTNVDTIGLEQSAAPGNLIINNTNVTPLASTQCSANILHYAVASTHQSGRIIGMGHEGFLTDNSLVLYDNQTFLNQAINWLSQGNSSGTVTLKNGWINTGNTSVLQAELQSLGYTFNTTSSGISSSILANTDLLILGNDWNGNAAYTPTEISAINTFVSNGGGLLIVGLGWSWPGNLSNYPMNMVANQFGFEYTNTGINSNVYTNLHPIDTTFSNCPSPFFNTNISRGDTLRIIRLAVSVTGEFTQENGGVSNTEVLLNNWLEDINTMYGREYCMRFELVPNNTNLIFSDPSTDPWETMPLGSGGCNNSGVIMADQQSVVDSIIGSSNYDVSHVILSTQHLGGGCAGSYTSGISGGFNIPVTRHEIGHQFGQSHTINHSGMDNYEPENGNWTVQGGNGHGRAHAISFHQLALNLLNNPLVGQKVPTENAIPTLFVGQDVTIPKSTPFLIQAESTDVNPTDSLTYVWDNMDRGFPQHIPVTDDAQGALFMRLLPTTESSRMFPKLSDVLENNTSNDQEQLPSQSRTMNIRVTVNDNATMLYNGEDIPASGINSDDISITVDDSGPFEVTSQNIVGSMYMENENLPVTWSVNGTNLPPVNTSHVRISLSIDGGQTFPYILADSTLNDGEEDVLIPDNIISSTARVKVEAIGNIYFDINSEDFEIVPYFSVTNQIESSTQVYPNPAYTTLYIKTTLSNYDVKLIHSSGQELIYQENTKQLDLSELSSGIYFLEIMDLNSNLKIRRKIIHY